MGPFGPPTRVVHGSGSFKRVYRRGGVADVAEALNSGDDEGDEKDPLDFKESEGDDE